MAQAFLNDVKLDFKTVTCIHVYGTLLDKETPLRH